MKVAFREANGFQYLVSYMLKLDRSLLAVRTPEWTLGRSECAISGFYGVDLCRLFILGEIM